jgi:hypothetical protein
MRDMSNIYSWKYDPILKPETPTEFCEESDGESSSSEEDDNESPHKDQETKDCKFYW